MIDIEKRRVAERMWRGKVPRAEICRQLGIPLCTLKDWRYRYEWPARGRWADRPVVNNAHRQGIHCTKGTSLKAEQPCEDRPVCFVCHGRSATWDGHPQCRGRRAA